MQTQAVVFLLPHVCQHDIWHLKIWIFENIFSSLSRHIPHFFLSRPHAQHKLELMTLRTRVTCSINWNIGYPNISHFLVFLLSHWLLPHSFFCWSFPLSLNSCWKMAVLNPWSSSKAHFLSVPQSEGFKCHLCINDTQIYIFNSDCSSTLQSHMSNFLLNISSWMSNRHLKLNMPKIQLLISFEYALPLALSITDGSTILLIPQTKKDAFKVSLTPVSDRFPHSFHVLVVLLHKCLLLLLNISTVVTLIQITITFLLDYHNSFLTVSLFSPLLPSQQFLLNIVIVVIL